MGEIAEKFFLQIQDAIVAEEMILPTLPEVALQIRDKIENTDCTFADIAGLLAQDAALSANF